MVWGRGREGVLDFFIKNNHVHRLEILFVSNISTWVLLICLFARSIWTCNLCGWEEEKKKAGSIFCMQYLGQIFTHLDLGKSNKFLVHSNHNLTTIQTLIT